MPPPLCADLFSHIESGSCAPLLSQFVAHFRFRYDPSALVSTRAPPNPPPADKSLGIIMMDCQLAAPRQPAWTDCDSKINFLKNSRGYLLRFKRYISVTDERTESGALVIKSRWRLLVPKHYSAGLRSLLAAHGRERLNLNLSRRLRRGRIGAGSRGAYLTR
ncbi:hypothetical protein EVAR_27630_1 [Eumeta japonica]|uniref:Uncharacterized protein n=1 Tax=Eumeta variegata TaxID=151549 RepID=A0A4C1V1L6_EUMVA|nr:hypothetical protein EVAR_27630_1 [Eumeta japonica]